MRYSSRERHAVTTVQSLRTHARLFAEVEAAVPAEQRTCMLLLVGGASREHTLVRHAQASLRYDACPSPWSHAALVLDWRAGSKEAFGFEVTHDPEGGVVGDPERNGVTPFRLSRYADARAYPDLCIAWFSFKQPVPGSDPDLTPAARDRAARAAIVDAVLHPGRDRRRYPLWRDLGPWLAWFRAETSDPPLTRGISQPAAAFCQYAFEAAGVDIAPAASEAAQCPEVLWASLLRWSDGRDYDVRLWRSRGRDTADEPPPGRYSSAAEKLLLELRDPDAK